MKKITLFPEEGMVHIERTNQKGYEHFPGIKDKIPAVLETAGLPSDLSPQVVNLDFENENITLKFHIPDMEKRQKNFLKAMNYEAEDLSSAVALIDAFLSGKISEEDLRKSIGTDPETNPIIAELLNNRAEGPAD